MLLFPPSVLVNLINWSVFKHVFVVTYCIQDYKKIAKMSSQPTKEQ